MSDKPTTNRTLIGLLVALILVPVALGTLGYAGQVKFVPDPVTGLAVDVPEDVPGPDTGPTCPVDKRYVDEDPKGLRPEVEQAWQRLKAKAREASVQLCVQDGKRSRDQQQKEFDEAVKRFGTAELASKYVLSPQKSNHVRGIAVDIQPFNSAVWVERNGGVLGWCRRYQNEQWHFEYDPAYTAGCPALLPSATGS
ncbi:hypothetical protein JOF53_007582 [Crossiella equi]|uniref:D-alanyl-D-alanine carboxypeptidase-like core domain-containing protein n=1 Tax=Crossiella equi TaxID=130796 RepID=A0ABS5AQ60_9PSEU|nr:D-alanyl-D-alanine carboxypeptidase family protein [Crossiella equi]MBP2478710.1 hypothetical protein [Crossiella equi]